MADTRLAGLGPKDRRRALRNRAARSRYLDSHPLAGLTAREIRQQAADDLAGPTAAAAKVIGREAAAGERNIAGIAAELAKAQGGYGARIGEIYGRSEQALGQLDEAQRRALGNVNGGSSGGTIHEPNTLADELRKRNEAAGLGAAGATIANQLADTTAGVAAAGFASGGAERGALIQNRASEEAFGAKLPELARLAGMQGVQQRGAQAQQDLGRLKAQTASSIAEAIQQQRNREFQKATAQLAYQGDIFAQEQQSARTAAQQAGANQRTAAQQAGANARTRAQQAGADRRARASNAERARHNKNMERISGSEHERKVKERRERARHNRAMEKIAKGKGLSQGGGGSGAGP